MATQATVRENKASYSSNTPPGLEPLEDEIPTSWLCPAAFTITLPGGRTVEVKFVPGLSGELRMHQFDLRGSVSPTGFQSHFVLAVESEAGWATPADYALSYAELVVAQFEEEQRKTNLSRSRSAQKAIALQEPATDRDNSSNPTALAETSISLASELEPATCASTSITKNELGSSQDYARSVEVLPAVMTEVEARQCIQDILNLGSSLRALLLDLDLRQGWAVLGYPSMTACIKAEFTDAGSKSNLIREWNAGQMELELEVQICTYPAYQLRPLRKLSNQKQRKQALQKSHQLAGVSRLTAKHVERAVNEILREDRGGKKTSPSKYKPGDLIRIQCAAGALPEQKAWSGCWGIVQSTGNISCVRVLVGGMEVVYMTGDLDWEDNPDPKFRDTCSRILVLWQTELEPIERTLLKELQRRYFFTDLEIQMISLMEAYRKELP